MRSPRMRRNKALSKRNASRYPRRASSRYGQGKVNVQLNFKDSLRSFRNRNAHLSYRHTDYMNPKAEYTASDKNSTLDPVRSTANDLIDETFTPEAKLPYFRASIAHFTTLRIILSFQVFRLRALYRGQIWREKNISPLLTKNAQIVYQTIVRIQGLFIKFGQLISVISYAIPEEFRRELEALQDKAPQRKTGNIIKRIERDLGKPIESVFSHFNTVAIASASLAQVHEAMLHNGERVVVKVQHLGIEREVRADLRTFTQLVYIVDFFFKVRGLKRSREHIAESIMDELSYHKEAEYLVRFAESFAEDPKVKIPDVYLDFSSDHVLTMEYVEGIKANDYRALDKAGINRKKVAKLIIETYCQMIFQDGLVHADPHPGNILVNSDASVTFLDFGSTVVLTPRVTQGIVDLTWGALTRNKRRIIRGLKKVKFLSPSADQVLVEKLIDYVYDNVLDGGLAIDNFSLDDMQLTNKAVADEILEDLEGLGISYDDLRKAFQMPSDIMLMSRVLMMLGGLCYELDPDVKPFDIVRPFLQRYVLGTNGDWQQTAKSAALSTGLSFLSTVDSARQLIEKANRGELSFGGGLEERKSRQLQYHLFQQFIATFLSVCGGAFTYYHWMQGSVLATQISAGITVTFLITTLLSIRAAQSHKN